MNDEPVFKLLQADAGAQHLIGFAKSRARRLFESGAREFTRKWFVGGAEVEVRASTATGQSIVRIWLRAGGLISYFYPGTAAIPCVCRGLSIVVSNPDLKTRVLLDDGTELASLPFVSNVDGTQVDYPNVTRWGGDGWVQLFNTAVGPVITPGTRLTFTVPPDVCRPAEPDDAPTYPGQIAKPTLSAVVTSGGFPNGSVAWDYLGSDGVVYGGSSGTFQDQNAGGYQHWSNYLAFGYVNNGTSGAGGRAPTDPLYEPITLTTIPLNAIPAGLSAQAALDAAYIASTGAYAAAVAQWPIDWAAARVVATTRERTRRKLCSDNLKTQLAAGPLPAPVHAVIRTGHLTSSNTFQKSPMSIDVQTAVAGSVVALPGIDITTTKVVTLSYMDAGGTMHSQQLTGTRRDELIELFQKDGSSLSSTIYPIKTTLVNWMPVDIAGVTKTPIDSNVGAKLWDVTFLNDAAFPLFQIQNGVFVTKGATSIAETFDANGDVYVPPMPFRADNRAYSYPQIYRDYRRDIKRVYDAINGGNASWLDSVFLDGEFVDVFPISTIHSTYGDLGMFPAPKDTIDASKLSYRCDTKATYKYTYLTGAWTFVSSVKFDGGLNADGKTYRSRPVNLTSAPGNIVFRSRVNSADEWKDVAVAYKDQKTDIKNNPTLGGNPVFIALAALKTSLPSAP